MSTLCIHLLGPFEVFCGSQPLAADEWRSHQVRAILKVLVARRGHVVPTDQLLELLWPAEDPSTARRRLHVRLSELRRALAPDDPAAYVLTVAGGYTFNPHADCWIDVAEFETCARRGQQCQDNGDLSQAIAAYESAQALYRGDYLEEDLYEDWTFADRERLRESFLTLLTELAECYARQGRYRHAIARCHQVLASDPCREGAYLRLMLYHYHAGESAQALRTYERCRQVLADELGVTPLPATVALAEQIRAGALEPAERSPRYPPPAYAGRLFEVPYSLGHTPFVGREREYAWLIERWRDAPTSVLLVGGEAGVGKSRLVDEFLGYAAAQGVRILRAKRAKRAKRGRASSGEGLPYAPVVAALHPLLGSAARADIPIETLAALAPLFPMVRRLHPDLPALPALPAPQEQERFQAAAALLVQKRASAGTLLFVDDAHRADVASLELLARLADHLTVVMTYRSEETSSEHPLRIALRPLGRQGRLAELVLERLPPLAVQSLIHQLAGADLPAITRQVVAQTDGNPLFVIALLQHAFEEGALYVDAAGRWAATGDSALTVPPTIRELVEARLRRLSPDQRRVFDLAAVIGGEFDFALLQHASQLAEDPLLDALDTLGEAGLLVEPRAGGRKEFAPAHDRYVEVAYDTLPTARRRRLHHRVAEALAATEADLDAAAPALAHHFEQAGDAPRAFSWLVRAGDAAAARYAPTEALAFYQRAIALDAGETAPVWDRMGGAAHHLARYADGVRFHEAALARWQALGEPAQQVSAHYALAECHRELSQYDQAAEHARAGLELAAGHPDRPALIARGHIILSNALRSGQLVPMETVRAHLEQAVELARPAQAWDLIGQATFWLGVVAVNAGDPIGALACDREALAQFRRAGQASWEAITLNNLAYHALLAGQADLALETAEEGLALARRIGAVNSQGWLLSTLGEAQTHLGRLEAAQVTLAEGLALVTRWGPPRLRPGLLADLGRVAIARGEWRTALAHLEEALALALATAPQFVPRLRVILAEAYLGLGELAPAEAQARQAQEAAQEKRQRSVEGQAWRVLGAVHAAAGRAAAAEAAFARSLDTLSAAGDVLEIARTRTAWGRWLAQQGDGRAVEWLTLARQTFETCHAVLDLRQMERP